MKLTTAERRIVKHLQEPGSYISRGLPWHRTCKLCGPNLFRHGQVRWCTVKGLIDKGVLDSGLRLIPPEDRSI